MATDEDGKQGKGGEVKEDRRNGAAGTLRAAGEMREGLEDEGWTGVGDGCQAGEEAGFEVGLGVEGGDFSEGLVEEGVEGGGRHREDPFWRCWGRISWTAVCWVASKRRRSSVRARMRRVRTVPSGMARMRDFG